MRRLYLSYRVALPNSHPHFFTLRPLVPLLPRPPSSHHDHSSKLTLPYCIEASITSHPLLLAAGCTYCQSRSSSSPDLTGQNELHEHNLDAAQTSYARLQLPCSPFHTGPDQLLHLPSSHAALSQLPFSIRYDHQAARSYNQSYKLVNTPSKVLVH